MTLSGNKFKDFADACPVLLFSITQGEYRTDLLRDVTGELWRDRDKKSSELSDRIRNAFPLWFYEKKYSFAHERKDGVYYGMLEELQELIRKTFPDCIVGDIQVERGWSPFFPRESLY